MAAPQMAPPQTLGDLAGMEFTRGNPNEPDARGATLVERHNERMQQEKEETAVEKLSNLMPALGSRLRAFALAKTDFNVDAALQLLRSFQVAELDKLNAISKKRKRILEEIEEAAEGPAAGGDGSGGGSGSDDSGSSASEDERRPSKGKKGKDKEKKRSGKEKDGKKKKKKERRSKEEGRGRDKARSKDKKRRRSSDGDGGDAARPKAHSTDFGRFGVIRESDADGKRSEFLMWALDVKKVDVEALAKWEEKELFKEFVEDFNTGTLPDRKYYDLAAYEMALAKEQADKAAKRAAAKQGTRKAAELGDEKELTRRRQEEAKREQDKRVREAMNALRKGGMAEEMRRQELLRQEMALAYKTGDTARAQKIFERLAPDDPAKKR